MKFSELGLSERVLAAVEATGYTTPTPIQAEAIPHVLQRRDVLGIAQTGTGKTAAFTLPMLSLLEKGRAKARMPRTLILEPTRELAAQVEESFNRYSTNQKLNVALLIGGVSFGDQDAKITRGVDVLIATPGRLLDHFERGKLLLSGVELLVIDEADRMLDMGFIPDIERICKMVPFTRQTLFFTATMPPEIQRVTAQFLSNPVKIEVARASSTAATIKQRLVASGAKDFQKREVLRNLIRSQEGFKNAIIFANRKIEVATLCRSLVRHGLNAAAIHGDLEQSARMAALDGFRAGRIDLLIASDVAARGLDIPDVSHVFNYDLPTHAEDYVHRIGRTGRAGKSGTAISIVCPKDDKYLNAIESLTKSKIEWEGPDLATFVPPPYEEREERPSRGRKPPRPSNRRDHAPRRESTQPLATDAALEPTATGEVMPREPRAEREPRPERAERAPRHERTERAPRAENAERNEAPVRAERSEPRAERSPRPDREPRQDAPRQDAPRQDAKRQDTQRQDAPRGPRPDRAPRDDAPRPERARHHDREDREPTPKGLGDHMPGFLMRSVRIKQSDDTA